MSSDGEHGDVLLREAEDAEEPMANGNGDNAMVNKILLGLVGVLLALVLGMTAAAQKTANSNCTALREQGTAIESLQKSDDHQNRVDQQRDVQVTRIEAGLAELKEDVSDLKADSKAQNTAIYRLELAQERGFAELKNLILQRDTTGPRRGTTTEIQ